MKKYSFIVNKFSAGLFKLTDNSFKCSLRDSSGTTEFNSVDWNLRQF